MRFPLLTTFLPQSLISLLIGVVTIVIFSNMHESASTQAMRNSLDGSLQYVAERVAAPFEKQRADAIQLAQATLILNHEAYRGDGVATYPNPLTPANLLSSREYFLQQRAVLEAANGSYQYIYQQFRTGRKPGASPTSHAIGDYDWGWSGLGADYIVHHKNGSHAITFSHGDKKHVYNTADVQINSLNITGWKVVRDYLDLSTTNNPQGAWTILDLWIDVATGTVYPGVPYAYAYPMTFDPVTGNAASLMVIDMDCNGWMTQFLKHELVMEATEVTLVDAKSSRVLVSTLTSFEPGYTCPDANDVTSCRMWGVYDSTDARWKGAMQAIDGLGVGLENLAASTTIIEPKGSKDIISVRPVQRVPGIIVVAITKRSYYFEEGDTARRNAIIIAVVLLVASLVVVVVTALLLARPLRDLGDRMEATASMSDDSEPLKPSLVSEIGKMQDHYLSMKGELTRMKAYLPQSVLNAMADDDDEENDMSEVSSHTNNTRSDAKTKASDNRSTRSTVKSSTSHTSATGMVVGRGGLNMSKTVVAKRVVVGCFNTIGFHENLRGGTSTVATRSQTAFLQAVSDACRDQRGVIDFFQGDRVVASWNAVSNVASAARRGALAALEVAKATSANEQFRSGISVGLSMGEALVGNMGTTEMQRFNILGRVYTHAVAVERLAAARVEAVNTSTTTNRAAVLVSALMFPDLELTFKLRAVDLAPLSRGAKAMRVFNVQGVRETGPSDEWMYELQQNENSDESLNVNVAYQALEDGDEVALSAAMEKLSVTDRAEVEAVKLRQQQK